VKTERHDIPNDPNFSHYLVEGDRIIGEAKDVETESGELSFAYIKLWGMEEFAEYGTVKSSNLVAKNKLLTHLFRQKGKQVH